MPNKPARYGIKLWVACDARSSYAWKMQVYTGKKPAAAAARGEGEREREGEGEGEGRGRKKGKGQGGSEKNQATRVVLDVTEGLTGRNVTCDNFFTSYELAQRLLRERNNTLLGTIRKNKPELPPALLALRGRRVLSSKFAFTRDTTLVSYLAKKNKNVLLLSTFHTRAADVVGWQLQRRADKKPAVILDYNSNKGGVDNLDKVVSAYSCRRMTARWPLALFHNILDVSSYNAFVIWRELNPGWLPGRRNKRRVFLEQLGKALVAPLIERRARLLSAEAAAAVVKSHRLAAAAASTGGRGDGGGGEGVAAASSSSSSSSSSSARPPTDTPVPASAPSLEAEPPASAQAQAQARGRAPQQAQTLASSTTAPTVKPPVIVPASKRKRCQVCPSKKDCKTHNVCRGCEKYICRGCTLLYCPACAYSSSCSSSLERGSV